MGGMAGAMGASAISARDAADERTKRDMRIIKTQNSLVNAFLKLLERRSFSRITVCDVCQSAMVGRSTFYAHFKDKYDLLEFWLLNMKKEHMDGIDSDEQKFLFILNAIHENMKISTNLVKDNDRELIKLLSDSLAAVFGAKPPAHEKLSRSASIRNRVITQFFAGGLMNILISELNNRFLFENKIMIPYVHKMLHSILELDLP
jgi:AcrR family transcriptional regulator